jgi:enamine deaminase RidA (YjgF/YER057c/UK114 family)
VWAADTLYCSAKSGFIPAPRGGLFFDNIEDQVRMSMRNLLDGLEEAGVGFDDAVAANVYVDNLDEFGRMNAIYGKYFGATPPTRTTVSPKAPVERKRSPNGTYPKLEEVSVVLVK